MTLLGLGAGAMYFLDPERGRRRRALARDQFHHTIRCLDETIQKTSCDLNNRFQGFVHEAQNTFSPQGAPDRVIEDRVRSTLGRAVSHPRAITVTSRGGHVTLQGPVLTAESAQLFQAVRSVRGVRSVDNQLELHDTPGNVPSLQGGRTRTGPRPELLQRTWSPSAKFLVGAAAAGTLWSLAGWRSPIRPLLALVGVGLVTRALMLNTQSESRSPERTGAGYSYEPDPLWQPAYDPDYPPTPVL